MLCAYQYYAPLPPVRAIVGQGGDLTNLNINCPNMRDIPYNQIPLQKVGDYWGFDTHSVTVQYTETIAVFKMSSEVIKCPTIGAASFGQSPYIARHLPVRGVVGHNIDRRIRDMLCRWVWAYGLNLHRSCPWNICCGVPPARCFHQGARVSRDRPSPRATVQPWRFHSYGYDQTQHTPLSFWPASILRSCIFPVNLP